MGRDLKQRTLIAALQDLTTLNNPTPSVLTIRRVAQEALNEIVRLETRVREIEDEVQAVFALCDVNLDDGLDLYSLVDGMGEAHAQALERADMYLAQRERLLRVVRAQEAWGNHVCYDCDHGDEYPSESCSYGGGPVVVCGRGNSLWADLQTARKEAGL